jgi:serine phosphatase RsbU (regulator of sigma subunit)/anti-sigma regulatory factor (Ser/Thr protein kinase)
MNVVSASTMRRESRTSLRLEAACEFSAVRAATLAVRAWLAEKNLPEADLAAWELALIEAANNAVKYAGEPARQLPVTIEISCGERDVEARITDHTEGFNWPEKIDLPDVDSESGRGLFLIKSLTDHVAYLRHAGENVLVLRRARPISNAEILPDAGQLQKRLADAETALTEMTAELASSYESLVALFRYSSELGAHADLKDFSLRLLKDLMQIAEADCAVLRLISHDGKNLETLQVLPSDGKTSLPPVPLSDTQPSLEVGAARNRQDIWFGPDEPLGENDPLHTVMPTGNGICHAFYVANQLVGTATLGRLMAEKSFTAAQVNLLHTFIDFLAIQIVNARLLDERTVARVTRRELQIAADIQRSLLPAKIPVCLPFEVAAACQSALQVGGDFYDIIPAGDGALLLVIADVMGKGVPAALFAAVLRSTIRSMPQLFDRPGELLATANRTLFPDLSRVDMFVTSQIAYLDPRRQKIISANAGHCPLLVWQPAAATATALGQSGFPLGIEPLTRYTETETPLPPGATALLYTDGLSETRNAAGEMLGEKNLLRMLAHAAAETTGASAGKDFLLGRLADFCGHTPLTDDQTLILIRHQP